MNKVYSINPKFLILISQDDHWERCFSAPFEDIPKAPGNGLILRQVHFDQYNKDWAYMHGAVDWVASQQKMENFVKTKILPEMFECDIGKILSLNWKHNL